MNFRKIFEGFVQLNGRMTAVTMEYSHSPKFKILPVNEENAICQMGASDTMIVRTTPHYIHQIVLSKATIVTHKIAHHWHDKNLQKANSAGCLLQHTHRELLHFGNIKRIEPRMYNSQTFAATCGYTFTREQSIWMPFLGSPQ